MSKPKQPQPEVWNDEKPAAIDVDEDEDSRERFDDGDEDDDSLPDIIDVGIRVGDMRVFAKGSNVDETLTLFQAALDGVERLQKTRRGTKP